MIAVEVKGVDRKYTWEITGTYRGPNDDMLAIETHTLPTRNLTKRSVIGGDLNLHRRIGKGMRKKRAAFKRL